MSTSTLPTTPRAWHQRVWALSWPVILSNATVPLVGAVDTAVVGQLPDPAYIGAVAFGALIFTFFAWVLGFLRMSTTGFIAQAWGAGDLIEVSATALRAALLAAIFGVGIIVFQHPIRQFAFWCLGGSPKVESLAATYYWVRVWSAPAAMINLVVLGILFGLQRMRLAFAIQLVLNGINISLDLLFVYGLGWGIQGVALATVMGELSAAILGGWLAWKSLRRIGCRWPGPRLRNRQRLHALLQVNANLTVRTLCVQFTSFYFMSTAAKLGDITLAANAVLLHFFNIMTFGLDGFAHAAEALAGQAYGARNHLAFRSAVSSSILWAAIVAVIFSLAYLILGPSFISWLTALTEVKGIAQHYLGWIVVAPLFAVWAYLLDGVFLATTRTVEMRNSMIISLAVYLVSVWLSVPVFGNHGLWLSMMIFLIARGTTLGLWYRVIDRNLARAAPPV